MIRSRSRLGALALALSLFVASTATRADEAANSDVTTKARALFETGGRAYDRGQYDIALEAFEQAYALVKRENLLFSMAQAHRRLFNETRSLHHRDEAIRLYREFLSRVEDGKRRAEANQWLGELESSAPPATGTKGPEPTPSPPAAKRTRLYVSSTTDGATATIDGATPLAVNTAVEVTPGKHKVVVTASGFIEESFEVDATANELVPVMAELREKPGRVDVTTASGADIHVGGRLVGTAPLPTPLELEAGEHVVVASLTGHKTRSITVEVPRDGKVAAALELDTTMQRDVSFVVFGLAGAAAIASGVTTAFAFVQQGRANDLLAKQSSTGLEAGDIEAYDEARSARDRLVMGASIAGGAAGALLLTGLGLFLVDPPAAAPAAGPEKKIAPETAPPPIDEITIVPVVGPEVAAAELRFRF
ncbi:MAG: PEGA domain-containing protein [Polyangiaceae bacterium]